MSLLLNELHVHVEDGGIYAIIDPAALMKHPETGEWIAAVIYWDVDPDSRRRFQKYCTTEERWIEKFRVRP